MARRYMQALAMAVLVAVVAVCGAGVASAQDVTYNALPGVNFGAFKTYKWVKIEGAQHPDSITHQQIMTAIDAELARKGLTNTDDDKADLYVAYSVAVDQEKRLDTYSSGGMGWGWHGYGYGGGMQTTTGTTSTINIGTLNLDMYSSSAKQLVWRGRASKTLDPKAKPEKRQKNITKATTKLLKNFPPKETT